MPQAGVAPLFCKDDHSSQAASSSSSITKMSSKLYSACIGQSMSSTKSATGHLLGAAGAIEAIYSIKAVQTGDLPPTLNLEDPEEAVADFDLVPLKSRKREVRNAMSNSFGFGGTNASLIIGQVT